MIIIEKPNGLATWKKKLQILEESPKVKIRNWKTGHDSMHRYWFKKFPSIHDRLIKKF